MRITTSLSRLVALIALLALMLTAIPATTMAQGGNGGNSANAHACKDGGWQSLYRLDGSGFTNQDECVSYGAQHGQVYRDSDGDGVLDDFDACPGFDDTTDVDQDSIPDCIDDPIDSDRDGVADASDQCPGFDDRIDTDGDDIPDGCDAQDNADSDGDGVENWEDVCAGHNDYADLDGDSIPNGCDDDRDGDSVSNGTDVWPDDPTRAYDADLDGVHDGIDNCATLANTDQSDVDGDGIGDVCDPVDNRPDTDSDGVLDENDNCVDDANPDQADSDGNGTGDACDAPVNDDTTAAQQACIDTAVATGRFPAEGFTAADYNVIVGTEGDDVLQSTRDADLICGLGGNDIVGSLGGEVRVSQFHPPIQPADIFLGGDGEDTVTELRGHFDGGDGRDTITNYYGGATWVNVENVPSSDPGDPGDGGGPIRR